MTFDGNHTKDLPNQTRAKESTKKNLVFLIYSIVHTVCVSV